MISRQNLILLLIAATAILGLVLTFFATPYGIGTSPDSVAYIGTAQNLRSGQGLSVPLGGFENQPLTQFPPLYPLLLAIFSLAGPQVFTTAGILAAGLFAANIFLVGWMLYRLVPEAGWAALVGSLGMLLAPAMLDIHLMAWSESLFILLGFGSLFLLSSYLQTTGKGWFAAAVLCGLALLTRYAGIVFLATGLLGLIFLARGTTRRRFLNAALFALIALAPLLLNLIYNQLVAGTATNRILSFHLVTRARLWQGLTTFTGWLGLPANLPTELHILAVTAVLLFFLISLYWMAKHPSKYQRPLSVKVPGLIWLLVLFALLYLGFLIISISFLDANTPLDNRILSPIFVSLWIVGVYIAARLTTRNQYHPLLRWAPIVVLAVLLGNWARLSLPTYITAHNQGIGFSTPAWQNSELIGYLATLPDNILIYSNAPDAVYLLSSRAAARLPRQFELSSQQENANFVEQMQVIGSQMVEGRVLIAYFTTQGRQSNPTQEDLFAALDLQVSQQFADGFVFTIQNSLP